MTEQTPEAVSPAWPALRVGDAERHQAAGALGEHFAAGRLETAELESRLATAYRARTLADLEPLFADLPEPAPFRAAPAPATTARTERQLWSDRQLWAGRPGWVEPVRTEPGPPAPGWSGAGRRPGPPVPVFLLFGVIAVAFVAVAHFPPFFLLPLFWVVMLGRGRYHGHRYGYGRPPRHSSRP